MRRLLDTCGGQPFLLRAGGAPRAGRYFDPTSAAGVRASAARRSRRALVGRGSLLAKLSRARRDTRYLSPVALGPPRSHARARAVRHGRSAPVLRAPWRVAHGLRTTVTPYHRAGGRGHGSLAGVLGFHLDQQIVVGRRAQAHALRIEGVPNPAERGAVHARPARSGHWGSSTGDPPLGARRCQGSRSARNRPHEHEAGTRLRLRDSWRRRKRAARRETGCSRALGSFRHADVEVRFGCSLTSWVRTSSLVAPRPRHLRQEGLPRAPLVPAAQSRMLCAVRSWESVSGTASELDSTRLRCGGGQPPQRAKGRDARGRVMCSAAKHGSACARPGPPSESPPYGCGSRLR